MDNQLSFDFLTGIDAQKELDNLQAMRASKREEWRKIFGWEGPKPGKPLRVDSPCAKELDGEYSYWYCVPCIAEKEIEPDIWIVRVEYSEPTTGWLKELNGTKLILDVKDMGPSL